MLQVLQLHVQGNLLDELVGVEARPPADFALEHFARHHTLQALERIRDSCAHLNMNTRVCHCSSGVHQK